ncbi:MAG: histidine phosphatase family protein [Alphaproteobacteria bacterium]|nr:histidine phosphatase family protein [Alphaproteobacteria bacterium]
MTKIIIARHGNTFTKEQTPTRVGGRTDLPLVETARGTNIGLWLDKTGQIPAAVFASPLKRTMETARLAIAALNRDIPLHEDGSFVEIDYGPDENKTEDAVVARIGQEAIDAWNADARVPDGWRVDVPGIIRAWHDFARKAEAEYAGRTLLAVSSNGIIRFAPCLTGDFEAFARNHDIKVGTGCVCVFEKEPADANWTCTAWNLKPADALK